jgi:hypothetical protein
LVGAAKRDPSNGKKGPAMQYQITGKMIQSAEILRLSHEDFIRQIQSRVLPSLRLLLESNVHGRLLAGGMPAGSRDLTMIVDLKADASHLVVREFLVSLPIFDYYDWQVTPLVTFEEMVKQIRG